MEISSRRSGIGFIFRNLWALDTSEFDMIGVRIHYHTPEDESPCPFRAGIIFVFCGLLVGFGKFDYEISREFLSVDE